MRFLIYADLHATDGNIRCRHDRTKTLQHYRVQTFMDRAKKLFNEFECDGVIDLGDTTDDRTSIPVPTIEILGSSMRWMENHRRLNFKLIGNHEQYLRNTEINTRRLFDHVFNVIEWNKVFSVKGRKMYFCAYPADYQHLATWLKSKAPEDGSYLFGHFEVKGCLWSTGVSKEGMHPSALSNFDQCFMGHVHIPQTVDRNVHYVGSPFQQDWGESGQKKRVCILDTDERSFEWVELQDFPLHLNISFSQFLELKSVEELSEHRMRVKLETHEQSVEFFKSPLAREVEPVFAYKQDAAAEIADMKSINWDLDSVCKRWMDYSPPSGVDVSREEMLGLGLTIAKED